MTKSRKPKERNARKYLNNVQCSYMNDTRWNEVLSALKAHQVPAGIKLLWDAYSTVARPGAEVITGYDIFGRPSLLRPQVASNITGRYWECTALGPFIPSDIEWLAIRSDAFAELSESFPPNMKMVLYGAESVIVGYDFMAR